MVVKFDGQVGEHDEVEACGSCAVDVVVPGVKPIGVGVEDLAGPCVDGCGVNPCVVSREAHDVHHRVDVRPFFGENTEVAGGVCFSPVVGLAPGSDLPVRAHILHGRLSDGHNQEK